MKYNIIISLIVLVFLLVGCATQEIKEDCVEDLSVLENKFGIDRTNIEILSEECTTCNPWYTPEVAQFKSRILNNNKEYSLFFSSNCPRHQAYILNYCISTKEKDDFYGQVKKEICNDIDFFNPDRSKILCDPKIRYGIDDLNSFIGCLKENDLLDVVELDEVNKFCDPKCNDDDCMISCFEEYIKDVRTNLFEELCDKYEMVLDNKIIFSVKYVDSEVGMSEGC